MKVSVPPVVHVHVPMSVKMENAGINSLNCIYLKEFNEKFNFRCPANSGTFEGFCSSGCLCSGQYECQNGTCGFIYYFKINNKNQINLKFI